jgi:hypothetical protein
MAENIATIRSRHKFPQDESVPPRGSGWVFVATVLLAATRPTRYRVVVLTALRAACSASRRFRSFPRFCAIRELI